MRQIELVDCLWELVGLLIGRKLAIIYRLRPKESHKDLSHPSSTTKKRLRKCVGSAIKSARRSCRARKRKWKLINGQVGAQSGKFPAAKACGSSVARPTDNKTSDFDEKKAKKWKQLAKRRSERASPLIWLSNNKWLSKFVEKKYIFCYDCVWREN